MKLPFHTFVRSILLFVVFLSFSSKADAQYCSATYYTPCYYYGTFINSVATTGGITNISNYNSSCVSSSSYSFFNTQTHTGVQGTTCNFFIENNPYYGEYYAVWVDFNADNDFIDAGEQVYSGYLSYYGTVSSSFTIPATATVGTTRMRVRAEYFYTPPPCGTMNYGETEDYNFVINASCAASITAQPVSSTICNGNNATFSVTATGATGGYQWQENTGSGFTNISNGGVYSGATTSTLTLTAPGTSMSGYTYRCRATNTAGACGANSNAATLTVHPTSTVASTTPNTTCVGVASSVTATPTSGGLITWYSAATGGSLLGSGNTLNIASPSATTTYYAQPNGGLNVAFPTATTGTNSNTGVFFDVNVLTDITLTGLDFWATSTTAYTLQVYYKAGTYVGFNSNSAAWTLLGTASFTPGVTYTSLTIPLTFSLPLSSGQTYGFYIVRTSGTGFVAYSNGLGIGNIYASNSDIQIREGSGSGGLFSTSTNAGRQWNGTFRYSKAVCGGTRTGVTLTVNTPPAITVHPTDVTNVCPGTNTSFSTTATGSTLSYQWQQSTNGGVSYNNLANGAPYSNVTAATMNITNIPSNFSGYKFRCFVSGACSPTATSNAATLTFWPAPTVTGNPSSTTVCPAGNTTFGVTATSGTAISYQWQVSTNAGNTWTNLVNGAPYSNVTTNTMGITGAILAMDGYQYRCIVSNCAANSTSGFAILNVNATIPITQQPQNATVCVNNNTAFNVVAAGAGIVYQWQVDQGGGFNNVTNGGVYSGATSATLNLSTVPLTMNGYVYRCVVSNPCVAPFTTTSASLTVNSFPGVATQPTSAVVCEGSNATFALTATGLGLTYQWQQNTGSGFVNLPATIFGYTGQMSATLTLINPPVSFNNYQYRCIISGQCAPAAVSNTVVLTMQGRPTVTVQPTDKTLCEGGSTSFTLSAVGTGISYQWQQNTGSGFSDIINGGIYSGATSNTLSLAVPPASLNGSDYRCMISGTCSPVGISNVVKLYVNTAPVVTSQPVDRTVCAGSNTSFIVYASAQSSVVPVTYQWQVNDGTGFVNIINGTPYSGATTNTLTVSPVTPGMHTYRYQCMISASCAPVAKTVVATLNVNTLPAVTKHPQDITACPTTTAVFSVTGTGTGLQYKWQENKGSGFVNMSDNAIYSGSGTPNLSIIVNPAMNSWQYRCVLSTICLPNAISNAARLNALNPVVIMDHTITDTVCEGGMTKFGVAASGVSLKYQWQKKTGNTYIDLMNIPPYSGVNTDSLRFSGAPDTIAGNIYRCRVYETILCGLSFYTGDIPLGMTYAPVTSPPVDTIDAGKTMVYTVVPGTGNKYVWQEDRNDGSGFREIQNAPPYTMNGNTLTISPVNNLMNGNKYRCIVEGMCKNPMISKPAVLTVNAGVGIKSVAGSMQLSVYPNPLEGTQLNLSVSRVLKGKTELKVLDKLGKVVYSTTADLEHNVTTSIELNTLAAGVYTLQIHNLSENMMESVRFTKQ